MRLIFNTLDQCVLVILDGTLDALRVLRDNKVLKIVLVCSWNPDASFAISSHS